MKFVFELENARIDEATAEIFVPIKTDISLDETWYREVANNIKSYNEERRDDPFRPICITSIDNQKLELCIKPQHQISQDMLGTQRSLLYVLSQQASYDLEARVAIQRADAARLDEARKNAPNRLAELKTLIGWAFTTGPKS